MNYGTDGYLIKVDDSGHEYIETACGGTCQRPYRIDRNHPRYAEVHAALAQGDRSVIHCYHHFQAWRPHH